MNHVENLLSKSMCASMRVCVFIPSQRWGVGGEEESLQ